MRSEVMVKRAVSVELATVKRGLICPAVPVTESFANGAEVPIPTLLVVSMKSEEVAVRVSFAAA